MLWKPYGNGPKYTNKSMRNIRIRLTLMVPLTLSSDNNDNGNVRKAIDLMSKETARHVHQAFL